MYIFYWLSDITSLFQFCQGVNLYEWLFQSITCNCMYLVSHSVRCKHVCTAIEYLWITCHPFVIQLTKPAFWLQSATNKHVYFPTFFVVVVNDKCWITWLCGCSFVLKAVKFQQWKKKKKIVSDWDEHCALADKNRLKVKGRESNRCVVYVAMCSRWCILVSLWKQSIISYNVDKAANLICCNSSCGSLVQFWICVPTLFEASHHTKVKSLSTNCW